MEYTLTRGLHFIGIILWLGGTIAAALAASYAAEAGVNASAAVRRFLRTIATPAMIAAWLGGLGMLLPMWGTLYSHAVWMHIKLTLVLVASGLSGAISAVLRKSEGGEVPRAKLRGFAIGLFVILIAVVGLVEFKPSRARSAPAEAVAAVEAGS